MPSKRSDLISPRDVEILDFIARFGVVPRSAVSTWAGTARTVSRSRERRLRRDNLIRFERGFGELGPFLLATKLGLKASGRKELPTPRISLALLNHESVVAELAARLEREGHRLLSEREILAHERAAGDRSLSAHLPGDRYHRSDLIRLDPAGGPGHAIEVELTRKGAARLDELLRGWRRAVIDKRVTGVTYHCTSRTLPHVERAIARTGTDAIVSITAL
jgi:hypothetical protein